ncbi:hypothetical protein GGR56DRAFT_84550 [Xylariaceae sp. FL0804]|nr:hypothetical protein GGR56DRAFT_84550 [Xylariaceae sp. FL0804]
MSAISFPNHPSPDHRPSSNTPVMAAQGSLSRRPRPGQVHSPHSTTGQPASTPARSLSSGPSSSLFDSPTALPENAVLTTNSSVQQSPDTFLGRDVDQVPPTPLALGDPVLRHRPSYNSINPSINTTGGAMAEVMNSTNGGKGLMRRLSNRATKFARTRRQSSVAPRSRDGSIGPGVIRRRSDSTNTAPATETAVCTDSDEEIHDEMYELNSMFGADSLIRDLSSGSTPASLAGSSSVLDANAGPGVPAALVNGTHLNKVSKKRKTKRMLFSLQLDAGKIIWDKGRWSKCIYIDDIKEVRTGSDIRQYRIDYGIPESDECRFFTILYALPDKSRNKTMHLIADDDEIFAQWVTALDSISKHREAQMASLMAFNDAAVRSFWDREMTKLFENKPHSVDEEEIDFAGVERVCRNLHIHVSPDSMLSRFKEADTTKTRRLNFSEFQVFVRELKRREDIWAIYCNNVSSFQRGMTFQDFCDFLRTAQGEDVDANFGLWETRFIRYANRGRPKEMMYQRSERDSISMTAEGLVAYLTSKDNGPLFREPAEYTLDRPFNEYFISSSHNTYLVGRQVADIASVEGYIMTLQRGCRSVEVDCWDGSDGQPTVKHGYAMTNSISFREVINTINKHAFVSSRFPLWISLEVHCNAAQQEVMAETIKEIFGSRLVTEPLDPSSDKLPSPSELKERILIKVKSTHRSHEQRNAGESTGRRRGNSLTSPFSKPIASDNSTIPAQYLPSSPLLGPTQSTRRMRGKRVDTITEGEVHDTVSSSTSDCDTEEEKPRRKTSKIVKTLGDLGVYCSGVKFHGFESADCKKSNHILSFMEGTFRKHSKAAESKTALLRHNMRYMMRVYPQYSRLASDNFNPLMYWRKGVQMAALNWQTFDLGMQLNQAMFDGDTDQSGYALKPESMREIRIIKGGIASENEGKLERQNMVFSINVISAQQLMRPSTLPAHRTMDPYVEIEVFHANDKRDKHDSMAGIPISTDTPLKCTTRVVEKNGFNPVFNHRGEFNVTTRHPELVFVKFSIKLSMDGDTSHSRGTTVATFTAKLCNLRQGYRTFPLLDSNGDQYLFSKLFCHIKVDPSTSVFVNNPEARTETVGKLKHIGRNVFSRSTNNSTKSSFDKNSTDSGYAEILPQSMV